MNTLDIIITSIIIFFAIWGFMKGVIRECFALVGVALGIIAANLFYTQFARVISQFISSPQIVNALAYAVIFFTTMTLSAIVGRLLDKFIRLVKAS
jgi:membrane protein required for colicin V production